MEDLCRICRSAEVDELISVSCTVASQNRTVGEMIIAVMGLRFSLTQYDRMHRVPGQLCDRCLARLDRAYAIWKRCRFASGLARCKKGEEDGYFRCRICASGDADELISVTYVCKAWNVQIVTMVYELTAMRYKEGDGLPAYVCAECLKSLGVAYEFRRDALESAKAFEGASIDRYPWQAMQFQVDQPERLVVDLASEAQLDMKGGVYCSVCRAVIAAEELEKTCAGCMLEFSNYDAIVGKIANYGKREIKTEKGMDDGPAYESVDEVEVDEQSKAIEDDLSEFVQFKQEDSPLESSDEAYLPKTIKPLQKTNFHIENTVESVCCVMGCVWTGSQGELLWHRKHLHSDLAKLKSESQLMCRYCDRSFPSLGQLNKHCDRKRSIFKCLFNECTFTAKNMGGIVLHYAKHGSDKPAIGPPVIEAHQAEKHIATEHITEYACCVTDCHQTGTMDQIQSHYNRIHPDGMECRNGSYYCQHCERTFPDTDTLRHHFQRESTMYKCTIDGCCLSSKVKQILINHCTGPHQKVFKIKPVNTLRPKVTPRPDLKCFKVVGCVDDCIDVLSRKGEWCCTCHKLFASEDYLRQHRDTTHPVQPPSMFEDQHPFLCMQCNAGFSDANALTEHVAKNSQQNHYYCRGCKYILWEGRELVKHRYLVHGQPADGEDDEVGRLFDEEPMGPFRCCGCTLIFYSEAELIEHRQLQHATVESVATSFQFQCEHCHRVFDKLALFREHQDKFRNLLYRCKIADCNFRSEKRLTIKEHVSPFVSHNRVPPPANIKLFQCCVDGCFFDDASYWTVTKHVVASHPEVRAANAGQYQGSKFSCQACGMGFEVKTARDYHVRRRRDQQQMACDQCPRVFGGKIALSAHKIRYHGNAARKANERSICNICGKQVSVYNMRAHLDVHNDVRRWRCTECPAAFNYKTLLQKHAFSHSGLNTAVCRYGCGKAYRQTTDRNRHEKLVHQSDQPLPYACTECDASFVRDRDLRIHSRKHTGLKLFPCERCGASFDLLREIESHREECVGEQLEPDMEYVEEYVVAD
ncbi:zinc finger protein 91-like [Culex pipiens pallens]|uniref:zinc finger protein 91-like n=1 Tax=Culex pipiens pallens TaxID=42434 RepID=UPI001953AFC2|nr:zinc finger protein 91-like [Culex pipiens pallens]